jgi:hypothetical protein
MDDMPQKFRDELEKMTSEEWFAIYRKIGLVTENGELSIVYGGKAIDSDEELEKFALDTVNYPGFAPYECVLIDLLSRVWDNPHHREVVLKVYNRELKPEFCQEIIQKVHLELGVSQ